MSTEFGEKQFQRQQFKHKPSDLADRKLNRDKLRDKVKLPAYGLIIAGAVSLAVTLGGLVFGISYSALQAELIKEQMADALFGPVELPSNMQNIQAQRAADKIRDARKSQAQMVVTLIVGSTVIGALIMCALYTVALTGGVQMMRFQNYKLCRLACIIAVIPLVSPLIVAGIPFGIWGLARLAETDIKRAFE